MVNRTQLAYVRGTASLMRLAVAEGDAIRAHRSAFGPLLNRATLMQKVLANLCIEAEAATLTAMRLAGAFKKRSLPVCFYWPRTTGKLDRFDETMALEWPPEWPTPHTGMKGGDILARPLTSAGRIARSEAASKSAALATYVGQDN